MYRFVALGKPKTQGSTCAMIHRRTGTPMVRQEAETELKRWRKSITVAARTSPKRPEKPIQGGVRVEARFHILKPKSNTDAMASTRNTTGDLDKLLRALLDGISDAGWWNDDAQVVEINATKVWSFRNDGVEVHVVPLEQHQGTSLLEGQE